VVMTGLRKLLGEPAMDGELRGLFEAHRDAPGRAVAGELVGRLRAAARPEDRPLVDDWLTRIVLYDLRLESALAIRRPDGRYATTLRVAASRVLADPRGGEAPLALRECVDLGLFTVDPESADAAERVLHLEPHELRSGMNEFILVTARPPAFAAVDPDLTRVDKNRSDNALRVTHR